MDPQKSSGSSKPSARSLVGSSLFIIACCIAVVLIVVFIGIIVIYGGSQSLQPNGISPN
jgi:hypothetical protein